jgi:hypothetical protein
MATSNAQRFLTKDGDDRSIALTMFWGTVLEAFRAETVLWNSVGEMGVGPNAAPVIASRTVTEGKSWDFPIIGDDPTPEYHTPGTELLGQDVSLDKGTITIDDILVSHYDVPLDQVTISHFDVIAPFARKLGRSLATDFDKKLIITGVKAARTGAVTGIHSGGQRKIISGSATVAAAYPATNTGANSFRNDVAELAQLLDDINTPMAGRYLLISPYIRRILGASDATNNPISIWNKDFTAGENGINSRTIGILEGFQVLVTTHLPDSNITTGPSKYQGNFTVAGGGDGQPAALALCGADEGSAAIGYVTAGGVQPHLEPDHRRNTTFMKAQMMVGAGVLSPWCAGIIDVDNA